MLSFGRGRVRESIKQHRLEAIAACEDSAMATGQ